MSIGCLGALVCDDIWFIVGCQDRYRGISKQHEVMVIDNSPLYYAYLLRGAGRVGVIYDTRSDIRPSCVCLTVGRWGVRLQNEVVLIFTTHYLSPSRQCGVGTDWNGSHPSCCHFRWSLTSRLTVQYCLCFLLNHFAFFIILWKDHAACLQEQILVRIVRLPAEGYSQREVARMLGVSQGCINKILRGNRSR